MIVYNCPMVPFEFFKALGVPFKRIKNLGCEFNELNSNICSFCRKSVLSVDKDDIVVWIDSCDSARRTADFLKQTNKVFELHIPTVSDQQAVLRLSKDLKALWQSLKSIFGDVSDERLFRAQKNFEEQMKLLERALSGDSKEIKELYEKMTGERWIGSTQSKGKSILVLGAPIDQNLVQIIEENGGNVINATCSGVYSIISNTLNSDDVFRNIAYRILNRKIMCMRSAPQRDLSDLIDKIKPSAIVLHTIKFCDFYNFDEREIRKTKIPFVVIENDLTALSNAQIKTRIQALMELLTHRENAFKREFDLFVGIDSGSTTTKISVINTEEKLLYKNIVKTGAYPVATAKKLFEEVIEKFKVPREKIYLVCTGYGRATLDFAHEQITEITCHARGVHFLIPEVRTIIDIGGQDSKVIKVENGQVVEFVMNDKCAAGTGRFLEVMANVLDVPLQKIGKLSLEYTKEIDISSVCTVFAESEVVSLRASGHKREDILYAIHKAIARRISAMYERVKGTQPVILTGGVALNEGVKKALERILGIQIQIPPEPVLTGALGAAVIGHQKNSQ
ncbi:acyl-CoA dehydratase activase [Thermotoga profunda]|uniref:acyl-CoA dehydratase activase n=1 Tax=Thermotoga profunda TaxID=1508420 RepID=UPI0005970E5F|nr:acyl-CoA dehydratase activase [Thermotoga profunda]